MVLSVVPARAQKEGNNWFFGYGAAITFNTTPPSTLDNSNLFNKEGCSSVSDSLGNLLFYSNGMKIWSKNHSVMENGDGLKGNASSTHAALIVPQPNSTLYYVFTLGEVNYPYNKIYYSIIDISKNNGLGSVISKNNYLFAPSMEKIAAVQHQNEKDFWVVAPIARTDTMLVYRLTEKGLESDPQKFATGMGRLSGVGQMKFSFNGKKLALAGSRNVIFDFDNATGRVSNGILISRFSYYGLEFSPNNKYLYLARGGEMHQCEIDAFEKNQNNLETCKTILNPQLVLTGQLQAAPNKKIYLSIKDREGLAVINYPNNSIDECGFEIDGLLLDGKRTMFGLPTFPIRKNHFPAPEIGVEGKCLGDSSLVSLKYLEVDSAIISFGDGYEKSITSSKTKHYYANAQSYTVKAITYVGGKKDSLTKQITIKTLPALNLGGDTLLCQTSSITYNLNHPTIENYKWSTGSTSSSQSITLPGVYWVETSNSACVLRDTVKVELINNCQLTAANFCYGDDTELSIANTNADSIIWHLGNGITQTTTQDTTTHTYPDSGTYTITAQQYLRGLSTTSTKQITITRVEKPNLGNDTIICQGKNLQINHSPIYDSYKWNDSANTPVKAITKQGLYWLEVEKNNCKERDSIEVILFNCQITTTNKCLGDSTTITTKGNNADSIQWRLGDNTTQTTTANQVKHKYSQEGDYTITANIFIQGKRLEINAPVSIIKLPQSNLPKDTTVCENQPINSRITSTSATLQWSDGSSTLPYLLPKESKTYTLTIKQGECENKDSVEVTLNDCGCELYFPNAYTPDNNNLNEQFLPTTACPLKKYKLQIYNRWGALIFESRDINNSWDGIYKNQPVPVGTYLWVASYQSEYTGKKYNQKGSVTVLR